MEPTGEKRDSRGKVAMDPEGNETRALHGLEDFRDKDVVEIGCGEGRMTWRYADQARSVLAIDTNSTAIEHARQMTSDTLKSTVTFRVDDCSQMVLAAASFDTAILSWSL